MRVNSGNSPHHICASYIFHIDVIYERFPQIIEGVGVGSVISEDYGVATERQCMTRAPSDNKERCAYVVYRGKQASSS